MSPGGLFLRRKPVKCKMKFLQSFLYDQLDLNPVAIERSDQLDLDPVATDCGLGLPPAGNWI
jgi:hypothetical protein